MTLDAASQLLASALLLLQAVTGNPDLPQSVRDNAQAVAQSAITAASRTIAAPRTASTASPSCTITSDKPNYAHGEIIVLSWTSANATSFEFLPDDWRRSDAKALGTLGPSGTWYRPATVHGYPFVTMKVTGSNGETATCSKMMEVY